MPPAGPTAADLTVVVSSDDVDGDAVRDLALQWHEDGLLGDFAWVTPAEVERGGVRPAGHPRPGHRPRRPGRADVAPRDAAARPDPGGAAAPAHPRDVRPRHAGRDLRRDRRAGQPVPAPHAGPAGPPPGLAAAAGQPDGARERPAPPGPADHPAAPGRSTRWSRPRTAPSWTGRASSCAARSTCTATRWPPRRPSAGCGPRPRPASSTATSRTPPPVAARSSCSAARRASWSATTAWSA